MNNLETEFKFLVDKLPSVNFNNATKYYIDQIYFDGNKRIAILQNEFPSLDISVLNTFRVRKIKHLDNLSFVLTLKSKSLPNGMSRYEYEKEISEETFNLIVKDNIDSEIIKNRYVDMYNGYKFEFDEYLNLSKNLVTVEIEVDKVLSIIKFAGLGMVILTFFTVIFIIVPITGFLPMYSDLKFITHFVLPVIAVVSYFFFEEKTIFEFKYMFFSWLPPVIYSCVYIPCVVFFKVWPDLYQINTNGLWFIFSPLTCIFGFALATGFYFLKKLSVKETKKKA